jgi:hypothetical protein
VCSAARCGNGSACSSSPGHTEPVGLLLVSGWSGWSDYPTTVEVTEDFLHADSRADAAPGA